MSTLMLILIIVTVALIIWLILSIKFYWDSGGQISFFGLLVVAVLGWILTGNLATVKTEIQKEKVCYEIMQTNSKLIIANDEITTTFTKIKDLKNYENDGKIYIVRKYNMYGGFKFRRICNSRASN